jgi:hypothetical protein
MPDADPLSLMFEIAGNGDRRVAKRPYDEAGAFTALVKAGLVVPSGVFDEVVCDACDSPHFATVLRLAHGRFGWRCPLVGLVEAEVERVSAFDLDPARALVKLAEAASTELGRSRYSARLLPAAGSAVLGVWAIRGMSVTFAISFRLGSMSEWQSLTAELRTLPRTDAGILIVGDQDGGVPAPDGYDVMPVSMAFELKAGRVGLLVRELEAVVGNLKRAGESRRGGRPSAQANIFAVLDAVARNTDGCPGAAQAKAAWSKYGRGEPVPSASTFKRHAKIWRERRGC